MTDDKRSELERAENRSLEDLKAEFLMHKHGHYYDRKLTPDEFRAALTEAVSWGFRQKWIAVADRLPEDNQMCFFYTPGLAEHVSFGYFQLPEGIAYSSMQEPHAMSEVTHWMPIPDLPPPPEK